MTEADRLIRAARAAGRRADRAALVAAAKACLESVPADQAWWRGTARLGTCQLCPVEAGLILLAGQGRVTHNSFARRVVYVDANPDDTDRVRLLAQVPPAELNNYALRDLAWLRIIGSDWRPVPPARPGRGRLTVIGRRSDRVAREVIEAFAAADSGAIADAIHAAAAFERPRSFSRSFSLFGFALMEEARSLGIEPGVAGYDF